MEENPSQIERGGPNSCKCRYSNTSSSVATPPESNDEGGDLIECSGKYCGSCAAGLIADCVAICCCPCGLINILAFAFVKVPWMVGRKCLGSVKKRRKRKKDKKMLKCQEEEEEEEEDDGDRDGNMRKRRVEEGIIEIVGSGLIIGEEMGMGLGGFEAERVWLELYKDGHLGFGRVSFTGIQ
ncbi:hypothetical protein M5689_003189 [Euphorbia peplus]|nr:hypothetical protein M5689_003189 [Euphorbia peplus]